MFGDFAWLDHRSGAQEARVDAWLDDLAGPPVVVELGAGTAVPSVRAFSERLTSRSPGHLVRINLREPEVPRGQIGIALGAREAALRIEALVDERA